MAGRESLELAVKVRVLLPELRTSSRAAKGPDCRSGGTAYGGSSPSWYTWVEREETSEQAVTLR